MKVIIATTGDEIKVSDVDYMMLNAYEWGIQKYKHDIKYAVHRYTDGGKPKSVLMHRLILEPEKGKPVIHRNLDGLDNTRENIEVSTVACIQGNRRISVNNTSGYKGVFFQKSIERYVAKIYKDRKPIYLGAFTDIIDAVKAYNEAATKLYGDFARLNKTKELS